MSVTLIASAALLATVTYVFRIIGIVTNSHLVENERRQHLMRLCAIFLIVGVFVTSTFFDNNSFAGPARILGVLVGVIALACRVPLVGALCIAAFVAALSRLSGLD